MPAPLSGELFAGAEGRFGAGEKPERIFVVICRGATFVACCWECPR